MHIEIKTDGKRRLFFLNFIKASYAEGIEAVMNHKHWSHEDMANYLGVSPRTVEGWCNGRKPSNSALVALSFMFN